MNVEIKVLITNEIDEAIECFARAIAQDLPNNKEEAKNWVYDEFHNPDSVIFGAFVENKLIGVCSLVPFNFILEKLGGKESNLIIKALKRQPDIDTSKVIYMGGFGVEEEFKEKGIGTKLFTFAEKLAINKGCKTLLGHTARPSKKYDKIKGLDFALSIIQMKKLPLTETIFLSSPNDLEKVWL